MPERRTVAKAKELEREGKSPTTRAGPFVEQEMKHLREHKHGARSTKQAIAIGLSNAREPESTCRRRREAVRNRRRGRAPSPHASADTDGGSAGKSALERVID